VGGTHRLLDADDDEVLLFPTDCIIFNIMDRSFHVKARAKKIRFVLVFDERAKSQEQGGVASHKS
jgi:hypothetical protein